MKNKYFLSIAFFLTTIVTWAQGPDDWKSYYQEADGLSGAQLKTKLSAIISKKDKSPSYDDLLELYKKTDTRADGFVRDWYSNTTKFVHIRDKAGNYSKEGDVYNREHTVPQSWGPPKADIVHVVPTDGYVNNRRGNLPFGEVIVDKSNKQYYESNNAYSKKGYCKTAGYTDIVFEPNDEVKGDIARIYFYMSTCYESEAASWSGTFGNTKYQPMQQWTQDMMMRWSKMDPIDMVEMARNDSIAREYVQGNRNPFVDYPGLEDYIWGDKVGQPFSYDNYEGGAGGVVVAMPVISPDAGEYNEEVEVSITTATAGATIYYTTDNSYPSTASTVYEAPFKLTQSATVKAIAVLDDGKSALASAIYTIYEEGGGGGEQPADGNVMLCNTLFNTNYSGAIASSNTQDLSGTANGITIVYSLGTGSNRYCNDDMIRLYPGNTLTVSVQQGTLTEIEPIFDAQTPKTDLKADDVALTNGKWTGNKKSVTLTLASTDKHARLTALNVKTSGTSGISSASLNDNEQMINDNAMRGRRIFYNLQGQRVVNPKHGIYIVDGRKVVIE